MIRAIAYLRVSTAAQMAGHGMDLQYRQIKDYAAARGYSISKIYREAHSAMGKDSISKRPELQKALQHSQRTGMPIFVSKVDRLGRHEESVTDLYRTKQIVDVEDGISCIDEIVGTLLFYEGWKDCGDCLRHCFYGPALGDAHEVLELREDLFEGIEIGAVGRQEE